MYTATQFLTYYFLGGGIHQMKNFFVAFKSTKLCLSEQKSSKIGREDNGANPSEVYFTVCMCLPNNSCFGY